MGELEKIVAEAEIIFEIIIKNIPSKSTLKHAHQKIGTEKLSWLRGFDH